MLESAELAEVVDVHLSPTHTFTKAGQDSIHLLEGLGVRGDAHCGVTVKHRSRVRADPSQPNLRQVHLIHSELFGDLHSAGFSVTSGDLGENITTRGINLLGLPVGTDVSSVRRSSPSPACGIPVTSSTASVTGCSSGSWVRTAAARLCVWPASWGSCRGEARYGRETRSTSDCRRCLITS